MAGANKQRPQRTLLRQTQASFSFLSISGASAPLTQVDFAAQRCHSDSRHINHQAKMAGDALIPDREKCRVRQRRAVRFWRKLLPTPPAAQAFRETRESREYRAAEVVSTSRQPQDTHFQLKLRPGQQHHRSPVISPFLLNPTPRAADQRRRVAIQSIRTLYRRANCCCWVRSAAKSIGAFISYW